MRGNSEIQGVIPLRTILRNFLNLVENCEASVKDGLDLYEKEFQELKQFSENLKSDTSHLCKEGEKTVNRKKNRYKDILPFDYTRVILGDYGDVPGSDYINANFIKGASGSSAYIACQGPLPHTVNDFWRMVVECEVQVIVMACNEQESGKHKCENYWVEEEAVEREFGQVSVWLKKCRQVCPDFLVRTMRIRYTNCKGETEERNVCQFHYSAWPDHGVPSKVRPLLDMVRLIRDCQTSETLPVLVHCSAGCGRTGTICAIDYVWGLLRLGKLTPDFSLFYLVRDMRRQRIAMVQTKDQYILVHRAVKELFEEQLKIIDSHPYANVDQNGLPLDIKSDLEEHMYETVEFHSNEEQPKGICASAESPVQTATKRDFSLNSKLEKEVENNCQHHEQERYNGKGPVASGSQSPHQKIDEIVVLSSDNEEKVEKGKESIGEKVNSTTSKPSRTSLLRKPSIVKLKAFFEKSKDDKKSGSTQLSRAKSDVSSRFYSFASSFNPRGHSPPMKISSPISPSALSSEGESIQLQKSKSKPALLAKPALPVKRSKSLKVGKGEISEDTKIPSLSKSNGMPSFDNQLSPSVSSNPTTNVHSASGFSTVTHNPIKVCMKQVDIPKMQKIVSKSVKPEAQTATTYEHLRRDTKNDIDEVDSPRGRGRNEELKLFPSKKPEVASRAHILKDNHSYVNVSCSPTKIKMGVAKEMEDVLKKSTKSPKYSKLKKYDTVTPKSMAALNQGTSLTRSQSNVWQPTKVQLPVRIFSDENIHQSGSTDDRYFIGLNGSSKSKSSSSPYSESNELCYEPDMLQNLNDISHQQNGSLDNSRSFQNKTSPISNGLQTEYEYSPKKPEKPNVRRRVPKTNPYANYIPSGGSPKYSSQTQSPIVSQVTEPITNSSKISQTYIGESGGKDLPHLKISYSRSRENSSESSSNTGTPRSSLPGTPTQTIDPAYTQLIKTNLQGIASNTKRVIGNGNVPPKSILKGSLSSTPSESDERLDSIRLGFPAQSAKPNVITAPQKISTVRIAVGNRERRNSFRQAVWKEEQPLVNGNTDVQQSPCNSYIFPVGARKGPEISNSSVLTGPSHRSHKDYEPIWPDSTSMSNIHFRTGSSSFYISSVDREASASQKPQIIDRSRDRVQDRGTDRSFNPSSFGPGLQFQGIPMSKRSHSEERASFADSKLQPELLNGFDEIKVMLEELKAPNINQPSASERKSAAHRSNQRDFDKIHTQKSVTSSTNLRHQRSLRAPSRPQYQQGLSCFTFRKPSSFESITDQLHAEEYQSFTSGLSPSSYEVGNSKESHTNPVLDNSPTKGRHVNDYVSLRHCRTSSQQREPNNFPTSENNIYGNRYQEFPSSTPVPPPRVKKLQQNARKASVGSNGKLSESNPGCSSSVWAENNGDNHQVSKNLPEIVRCTNYAEDNLGTSDLQKSGNPTSPKVKDRALGIFARFTNWTDAKDKSNAKKSNGTLLTKDDSKDDTNNDGGFLPSATSATQLPCPSRSKHQYL